MKCYNINYIFGNITMLSCDSKHPTIHTAKVYNFHL